MIFTLTPVVNSPLAPPISLSFFPIRMSPREQGEIEKTNKGD